MKRRWQDYPNAASNIAYLIAALYVLKLGLLPALAAMGLTLLAFGSWRFHWTHERADRVLDRLGMFASLVPTMVLSLSHVAGLPATWLACGAMVALFLLGLFHDRLYSYALIFFLAGVPIVINVVLVTGTEGFIPLAWYVMAMLVWALDAERMDGWGWLHSIWHLGTALGFALLISQLAR